MSIDPLNEGALSSSAAAPRYFQLKELLKVPIDSCLPAVRHRIDEYQLKELQREVPSR